MTVSILKKCVPVLGHDVMTESPISKEHVTWCTQALLVAPTFFNNPSHKHLIFYDSSRFHIKDTQKFGHIWKVLLQFGGVF